MIYYFVLYMCQSGVSWHHPNIGYFTEICISPQQSSNRTCNPSQPYTFPQLCLTLWKHGRAASFTKSLDYKQISANGNTTNSWWLDNLDLTSFIGSHGAQKNFFLRCFSVFFSPAEIFRHSPLFNPKWKRKQNNNKKSTGFVGDLI